MQPSLQGLADGKLVFLNVLLLLQDSTYKYFEIVMVDPHHKCVRKVGAIAGLHMFQQGKGCSFTLNFANQACCKLLKAQAAHVMLHHWTAAGPAHQLDCKSCAQASGAARPYQRWQEVQGSQAQGPCHQQAQAQSPGHMEAQQFSQSQAIQIDSLLSKLARLCAVFSLNSLLSQAH